MKNESRTIGIVTTPIGKAGINPLLNVINILLHFSNGISVITGNEFTKESILNDKIDVISIYYNYDLKGFAKIIQFVSMQLKISFNLFKIARNIDFFLFFYGGTLVLPMLASKILNKKVILVVTGSSSKSSKSSGSLYSEPLHILEKVNYTLADQIILDTNVESENLIQKFGLKKYRNKTFFGGVLPVDVNSFRITKNLKERRNIIGYIGRHSPEKGVMNFAKAIPLTLKERSELEFIIGSEGSLFEKVKEELKENGSYDKVTFTGWVPRDKLPDCFNRMKLIVVPSYTETIPYVILEAMACGTPIVASPVDAIPDLIRDGENGFLMENNSPACIAKNVIRALDDSRLDKIVKNAHDVINREYTYEKVVENYRKLLMEKG